MPIRKHALRFSLVFLTFIVCLGIFSVKLVLIQIFKSDHLASLADKQHNHFIELEPIRGGVYDRKNRPLAINVPAHSLYANPRMMSIEDKQRTLRYLTNEFGFDPIEVQKALDKNKYFVWLERKLSLETANKIKSQKMRGLGFINETKRYYPNAELAAHIIGFAGIDNEGLEGLELYYNEKLKGKSGQARILRDARQQDLLIETSFLPPEDGLHLVLTIDETIQYIAERALEKAYIKHKAKGATIIVIDTRTGEILALANRPTYNLEKASSSTVANRTNRAISFVYEPGSVFKIVTAAAALEEEKFIEEDQIFCENGEYRLTRGYVLHDHHPHGTLSFKKVFEQSSNIGVSKIAQKLGPEIIYKYAKRFRFGDKTGISLRGEVNGWMKHPSKWSKTSIGAIPMGQEVTVTPLQLVYALAAIANDGLYMKPYIVKAITNYQDEVIEAFSPQIVDRVISADTARRVREILIGAVENGTGTKAKINGMKVAGKTGTAQKVENRTYSHSKFYATFMGFAPADNPRLAAIVVFDEPRPAHFGGTVSAPVFKEVIENALKYLESSS